jgi:hypothetical protein
MRDATASSHNPVHHIFKPPNLLRMKLSPPNFSNQPTAKQNLRWRLRKSMRRRRRKVWWRHCKVSRRAWRRWSKMWRWCSFEQRSTKVEFSKVTKHQHQKSQSINITTESKNSWNNFESGVVITMPESNSSYTINLPGGGGNCGGGAPEKLSGKVM